MGESIRSNGAGKTFVAAVVTPTTFAIAIVSALAGYVIVEFLRRRT